MGISVICKHHMADTGPQLRHRCFAYRYFAYRYFAMTAELATDLLTTDLLIGQKPPLLTQAHALLSHGLAQLRQQNFEQAIAHFSQSVQLAYENTQRHAQQLGQLETAGIKEILAKSYYHRACTLCRIDCYAQAVTDFTTLLKQAADAHLEQADDANWLAAKRAHIYLHRGNAYRRLGQYSKALTDLDQGVERSGGSAQSYSCRGLLNLDYDNFESAITDFNQAINKSPTFAQGYLWRGFAHLRSDQPQPALVDLTRAIEAIPNCAEAYNHRGVAYFQLNELASAKQDFNQALQLNSGFTEAHNNRGNLRQLMGDSDGALADYNRAISTDPLIAELYFNRAATEGIAITSELDDVAADYDATAGLPLNSAAFYRHRAWVRSQQGHWRTAITDYTSAIAITPTAYAYYHRGRAYMQIGDSKQALEDLDRAIALSPDYGLAYSDRSRLRLQFNHLEGALTDANRALELGTHPPHSKAFRDIHTTRCLVHFCQHNSEQALQDFETLVTSIMQTHSSSSHTSKDSTSIGSASD